MKNEFSPQKINDMCDAHLIAIEANRVFDLIKFNEVGTARAIANTLKGFAEVRPEYITLDIRLELSGGAMDNEVHAIEFDGLVNAAAVLIPDRRFFDDPSATYPTSPVYTGPGNL
jgi:hypothetical protein